MPKASVKRLIECKKEQLINLVLDIENYPKFIPYCLNAKIHEKKLDNDDQEIAATDMSRNMSLNQNNKLVKSLFSLTHF